jgi:acetoin utilization protein AcuB
MTSSPGSTLLEITLKVSSTDLVSVIKTFERYNYNIKTWVTDDDSMDRFYSERFDLLMKYLDI